MGRWISYEWGELGENISGSFTLKTKKPSNKAPKNIKGDYYLSIHGNKIVLVDNADGTTVKAKCSPEDEFDIGEGIKEAFKKLNEKREELRKQKEEEKKINVGDWVEVIDSGCGYSIWYDWIPYYEFDLIKNFAYGKMQKEGDNGKVMYMKETTSASMPITLVYYQDADGLCHTIDIRGLRKVAKPSV